MATPNLSFQNFYTSTLAAGISATDTTVYLNSLPTGSEGYLVIEPDSSTNKEIIYYTSKGANFVTLPSVAAGRGVGGTTAVSHSSGVTVQMNVVAEHFKALQDGTAFAVGGIGASAYADGWTPILGSTPNTVTYNGNRNYDLVFNAVDLSSTVSPGQKLKLTRTVAAPTQDTSLNGTSQYFSKTSPAAVTFTSTFTAMGWVKLNGYGQSAIIGRDSASATGSGWELNIDANGKVVCYARNATGPIVGTSYPALPLNKWVHVAASLNASTGTVVIYFDGQIVLNSTTTAGTTIVQATADLTIGKRNSGANYLNGKLAQVALFNTVLSQATIQSYISQGLSGSESSLISAYSLSGANGANDLNTTNANNLTANGSATTTDADSPFANAKTAGTQEYAEINSVTYSTNTTVNVRVPDTCMIPTSGGISNVYYAVGSTPTGLPYFSSVIGYSQITVSDTTGGTASSDVGGLSITVYVPTNARIRLTSFLSLYNQTAASSPYAQIKEGSTQYINMAASVAAANSVQAVTGIVDLYPSAGTHTYKITYAVNTGNKSLEASTNAPNYIMAELVR